MREYEADTSGLEIEQIQRKIEAMNETIDQAMLEQNRLF
jgi:cell division protein ZapA